MTAIILACAHAYQTMCLAQHFPGVPHHTFRLPKPKSRYPYFPNGRSITSELGNDYHGWATYTDGGTRVVDGETLAGWCDFPIPSWAHQCHVWCCHYHRGSPCFLWCQNSLQQHRCNDMIEALSFLGPHGPVTYDEQSSYLLRFCACCWYLFGHCSSSYSCAACTCMSTISYPCPT